MARPKGIGRPWKGGKNLSAKRNETRSYSRNPESSHATIAIPSAAFTLVEEARQTSLHDHGLWSEHAQLRKNPVHFVSSGRTDPLKDSPITEESSNSSSSDKETMLKISLQAQDELRSGDVIIDKSPTQNCNKCNEEGSRTLDFDITGDETTNRSLCSQAAMSNRPAPPDSSSSEEVILFRGRREWEGRGLKSNELLREKEDHYTTESSQQSLNANDEYLSMDLQSPRYLERRKRKGPTQDQTSDEDMIVDYINNMRDNGELECLFGDMRGNQRDLGARDTEVVFSSSDSDVKHNRIQDVNKTARKHAPQHERSCLKSTERSLQHTEDTGHQDALVELIAAQELNSSSDDDAADTQTPEPDYPDAQSSRYGANKQERFDFMDWSTANNRSKKGKGYRSQVPFTNDDSDLERQLQVSWKNDRMRKKERKRQREELRSLGMLRSNAKPDDIRTKYPSGMNIEQVGEEVEGFLRNGHEVLLFPPMDLHARKVIHELANRFNIKSKSTGKADQRRPTLYRTIRTLPYAEAPFKYALNQIQRRFLPRLDVKGKRKSKPYAMRGQNHGAASYHEGEVVGASAPELGVDNRGRAMLERMGWSRGTALGAVDNKGILQPVTQTMKKSKAGLG